MRMNFLKNILLAVMLIAAVSCSDYLDKMPDDQLTLEMVFNDKVRTEDWLAGIYSSVPDPYWGFTRHIGYDPLSDDLNPSYRWAQFGWWVVDRQQGNWTPANTEPNFWDVLPKRIRSAYIFLENVKPNAAQKVTQEEVDLMKYEARFLIAYYYWLMTEMYGVIPFHPGLTAADATPDELFLGQTPFDDVISWIDAELLDLSTNLPASYSNNSKFGRATSIMCLAVRARMLLFAASPLVNGNPDYTDFVNDKGVALYNSSYDAGKWTRATDACRLLIEKAHEAGHKLYYEYNEDASIDPFLSYQNMMFKKSVDGNKEILFARTDVNSSEYDKHSQPRGTGGNGGLGVTQSLVDAFYMKNGLPITDPASGYVENGFSSADEVRNTKWDEVNGVGKVTLAGTYNMYCNREPRFYISVMFNEEWHRRENRKTNFFLDQPDGGPTWDAPQNGYLVRKKVHPDYDPRNGTNPYRPGILYRLGEAYLNYAEALNETDPGHPDVLTYLNLVRQRAGIPVLTVDPGQAAMREVIRRERRVELNCEGIRYSDIRRWKIGEQVLNGDFKGMNFFGRDKSDDINNPNAFYKRTVYQKRSFTKKNYWFPVPQSEIDKNPNLVQNPFW
jgi:starch-binding outer membrane protein, SusD/RagB family